MYSLSLIECLFSDDTKNTPQHISKYHQCVLMCFTVMISRKYRAYEGLAPTNKLFTNYSSMYYTSLWYLSRASGRELNVLLMDILQHNCQQIKYQNYTQNGRVLTYFERYFTTAVSRFLPLIQFLVTRYCSFKLGVQDLINWVKKVFLT